MIPKLKFFSGSNKDLDLLITQIDTWLSQANVAPVIPYAVNLYFQAEEKTWYILVTITYQDVPRSDIARPVMIPPSMRIVQ